MSRKWVGIVVVVVVVLFALSPAVQGYHVGASRFDTTCVTRLLVQFCKNNRAAEARKAAAAEAREAKQQAVEAANECKAVAREVAAGRWHSEGLNAGNYYLHCLRPSVQQALIRTWEANQRKEAEQKQAQLAHEKATLEAEAASLKQRAKRLTEEEEQLYHESKYSQGNEKASESGNLKREAEKKLEQAKELR
jgi:hypothetical protein